MNSQTAITLLKNLEQSLDDYCELNDEGKTAFSMAITALELFGNSEQLMSAQLQWIPVFERLPEEGTEVLGTDRNGCIRHVYKDKTGLYEFATVEEGMHIGIVAWMPLPEPYKEDKT